MTDFEIFEDGGNVRAKVKYVCGISDSFVSEHFCEKIGNLRIEIYNNNNHHNYDFTCVIMGRFQAADTKASSAQ